MCKFKLQQTKRKLSAVQCSGLRNEEMTVEKKNSMWKIMMRMFLWNRAISRRKKVKIKATQSQLSWNVYVQSFSFAVAWFANINGMRWYSTMTSVIWHYLLDVFYSHLSHLYLPRSWSSSIALLWRLRSPVHLLSTCPSNPLHSNFILLSQ